MKDLELQNRIYSMNLSSKQKDILIQSLYKYDTDNDILNRLKIYSSNLIDLNSYIEYKKILVKRAIFIVNLEIFSF